MKEHNRRLVEDSSPGGTYGCGAMLTETEIVVMVRIKATNFATIQFFENDIKESMAYSIAMGCLADWVGKLISDDYPEREDRLLERGSPDIEKET